MLDTKTGVPKSIGTKKLEKKKRVGKLTKVLNRTTMIVQLIISDLSFDTVSPEPENCNKT